MAASKSLTTYIALFHHRDNAASAIRDLEAVGFTRSAITVIGGGNGATYSESAGSFGDGYEYGSQSGLSQIGVPDDDRKHLQDGLAHGGMILSLEGAGERADEIEKIFSKHSTKKIDETGCRSRTLHRTCCSGSRVTRNKCRFDRNPYHGRGAGRGQARSRSRRCSSL